MNSLQRHEITQYLEAFDFAGLFTDATVGWDWPEVGDSLKIPTPYGFIRLETAAEKRGVRILVVPPDKDGRIPPSADRRAIEKAVRPLAAEHLLIFTDAAKSRQVWQWTQRRPGKPISFREITWGKGKANELLIQKLSSIAFTLDEEDALDITGVVQRLTDSLDRDRVTKRFYDQFKTQKDAFADFVEGLGDGDLVQWYTSLMLNRIMFCYFLQRKGFLDGDQNYLRVRLETVQEQIGEGQFHSFYRSFLRRLFHEGLGEHPEERDAVFSALIGSIPYLNGGIFDEHPIERDHPDLQIPDEAFTRVFAFFDEYDWHLDERPIGNDKEINPEVLGYVFEKYTNQREMGAYYTKEDITEYISKNCIIPFLFQKIAKKLPAEAWGRLKEDPNRYIYPAVRQGACDTEEEWVESLPKKIRRGLNPDTLHDVVELDKAVTTLKLRKDWNSPTPESHKLPTEIWRETIARHQRCHELRAKLRAGGVTAIDEFITLNLDIRQFAQDVVEGADAGLLLAFFKALKGISVLDPTCGSGAFLFAALEILQPLYLACLERMRILLADWTEAGERHRNWEKEIRKILDHAAAHPNEAYYIHKTIIVHNLYGVDIMEEAVEICKLRLFLKLAAQLEPGQEVEPLPDIDFNIRVGNTLVGYASKDEIQRAFTEHQGGSGGDQMLLGGIEHSLDDYRRILDQAEDADRAFQRFHELQEDTGTKPEAFRSAKEELNRVLENLRGQLDRFLAADYDAKYLDSTELFQKWRDTHQPFHWYVEFYGIINSGGFDAIVGNPPYVEYSLVKDYSILGYATVECGDLYAFVTERAFSLIKARAFIGVIIPISLASTTGFRALQDWVVQRSDTLSMQFFANRPSQIFSGAQKRLTILLCKSGTDQGDQCQVATSRYYRWLSEEREELCDNLFLRHNDHLVFKIPNSFTKLSLGLELSILQKVYEQLDLRPLALVPLGGTRVVYYTRKFGYFLDFLPRPPKMVSIGTGQTGLPSELKELCVNSERQQYSLIASLSSSLFFWFWNVYSDCRNLNKRDVLAFPCYQASPNSEIAKLGKRYIKSLFGSSSTMTKSGWRIETFDYRSSKKLIDEIDIYQAAVHRFTEEELDFIINYDIKYRMGLGS